MSRPCAKCREIQTKRQRLASANAELEETMHALIREKNELVHTEDAHNKVLDILVHSKTVAAASAVPEIDTTIAELKRTVVSVRNNRAREEQLERYNAKLQANVAATREYVEGTGRERTY